MVAMKTSWPCSGLTLFRSYIGQRYQCVEYDSVLSDQLPVKIDMPQGSILGRLFFIVLMKI